MTELHQMIGETPPRTIRVMLVEDNEEFARLVEIHLQQHKPEIFDIVWKENGKEVLRGFANGEEYDIILMDYFLPQQNGLEVTRILHSRSVRTPIIFLTVNKDFDLAVEVLKLGVEDYLVKEEIMTPALPKTILNVIERQKLVEQLTALEVTQKRLEVIQEIVLNITQEIRVPLDDLQKSLKELSESHKSDKLTPYLTIIKDNLHRLENKIVRLKALKTDKTVPYIKDIRMIDLSD
ncbi:MAG: response regulator [Ignavibacteria bacterium]|nr:response regulator [Ignavibacteria bacterium]